MSLQFKNSRNRNVRLAATAGAVIIGASYIILKTFPHLKTTIYNTLTGTTTDDAEDDDNEPIELRDSTIEDSTEISAHSVIGEESLVNVEKWSDDNLKSWLSEKEITPPSNASHHNLVSLVNSIKKSSA